VESPGASARGRYAAISRLGESPKMIYFFRKFHYFKWQCLFIAILASVLVSCESTPETPTVNPAITYEPIKLPSHIPTSTKVPTATYTPSPTGTPVKVGAILLYQSLIGGYSHLVISDLDYGTQIQLTDGEIDHTWPSWTPDGHSIVYQQIAGTTSEIRSMNWDGSGDRKLSREADALEYIPVVSPDGTKIAFFASYPGHWALFIMNSDGSNSHPITDNTVFESIASWSPDSSSLLFTPWHNTVTPPFIAGVDSDGRNYRELTDREEADSDPVYSPNGELIAFTCSDGFLPQICLMNKDGSGRLQLTSRPGGNDSPSWSPDGSQIAFVSWRDSDKPNDCQDGDCNFEVYVMNSDGSDQTNLSNDQAEDWYPSWSPDGKQIAFVSLRDEPRHPSTCGNACNSEIYVMNRDGSEVERVTENHVPDWNPLWRPPVSEVPVIAMPTSTQELSLVEIGGGRNQLMYWAQSNTSTDIYLIDLGGMNETPIIIGEGQSADWSPDGNQIVFVDFVSDGVSELFIMNSDGSHRIQITKSELGSWNPAWSPDGNSIAFSRGRNGIYIYDVASEEESLVIEGDEDYYYPAWSPDSNQIAFLSNRGQLISTLMTINIDGSNPRVISGSADWSSPPAWSPDGSWIAYSCFEEDWQVCKIKLGAYSPVILTHEDTNGGPSWSPDGEWLSFISYRDENWEVYIMRADGTDQERITSDWLQNFEPVWRP
jgi:Tol biopolymer transport system component